MMMMIVIMVMTLTKKTHIPVQHLSLVLHKGYRGYALKRTSWLFQANMKQINNTYKYDCTENGETIMKYTKYILLAMYFYSISTTIVETLLARWGIKEDVDHMHSLKKYAPLERSNQCNICFIASLFLTAIIIIMNTVNTQYIYFLVWKQLKRKKMCWQAVRKNVIGAFRPSPVCL